MPHESIKPQRRITFEKLRAHAEEIAAETESDPEVVTHDLVHVIGHEKIDFSGGHTSSPDEGAVKINGDTQGELDFTIQ